MASRGLGARFEGLRGLRQDVDALVERGFFGGVAAGLGAVLGDGLIAFCAAMGVGAISGAVQDYRTAIQVVGGLALLAFGAKLYATRLRIETALQTIRSEEAAP